MLAMASSVFVPNDLFPQWTQEKKIFKTNDEVLWLCDWELEKKKDFCLKSKESKKISK